MDDIGAPTTHNKVTFRNLKSPPPYSMAANNPTMVIFASPPSITRTGTYDTMNPTMMDNVSIQSFANDVVHTPTYTAPSILAHLASQPVLKQTPLAAYAPPVMNHKPHTPTPPYSSPTPPINNFFPHGGADPAYPGGFASENTPLQSTRISPTTSYYL